jgi:hypothetical protein
MSAERSLATGRNHLSLTNGRVGLGNVDGPDPNPWFQQDRVTLAETRKTAPELGTMASAFASPPRTLAWPAASSAKEWGRNAIRPVCAMPLSSPERAHDRTQGA